MELLLFMGVIWIVWALLAHRKKGGGSDRDQRGQVRKESRSPAKASNRKWQGKLKPRAPTLSALRQQVLSALRDGKLSQRQIAQILENAGCYNLSPEEITEFQEALMPTKKPHETGSPQPCRVCGMPSLPGEDLCYSHQAK